MLNELFTDWRSLPDRPALCPPANVHVLRVSLAAHRFDVDDNWAELSPDEVSRADRYVVEPPRRRFRLCRRAVRRCLGWFTQTPAAEVRFGTERNAKPTLAHPAGTGLSFNVSHSGDWGVIAVAWGRALGIDIESISATLDGSALAERFFSNEERAELLALPAADQKSGFYRLWTTKEAYMKAVGLGMAIPLGSFSAAADPHITPGLVGGDVREGPWLASGFEVAAEVPGVVMWNGGPAQVCWWDAPHDW